MKRKIYLLITLILLSVSLLFAADESGEWWFGKSITDFTYNGLQNVNAATVNSLLNQYKNQTFTQEVANEIDGVLYSQNWMDYYIMEAGLGADGTSLVLNLEIHELPMVRAVVFSGNDKVKNRTLSPEQSINTGDFFSPGSLRANARSLQDYYVSVGYRDASVTSSFETDEENNTVTVTYTITEGDQYKISAITFSGNSFISSNELLRQMDSKVRSFFRSGNFVQATLDSDLQKVISYYNERGYTDARIVDTEITDVTTADDKYRMLSIGITIEEGVQWLLGEITFEGNNAFSDEQIQNAIYLKPGAINNANEVSAQIQAIASLYYNDGYIQTVIDPQIIRHEDTNTIDYHIVITESAQSHIEKIIITGLSKTKPYVIERELQLHVGDVFSQSKLQQSGQNIMNTSIITDIQTGLYQGDEPNGVVLELALEEGNQMELQFGATFGGTVDGFPVSGFLQWSDKNLFGTGRDLSISTTLSPDTQSVSVSLSDDWVGDWRWSNGISLSFERNSSSTGLQLGRGSVAYDGWDVEKVTYPLGYDSAPAWYGADQTYPNSAYLMSYDMYRFAVGYNTGYTWMFDAGSLTVGTGLSIGLNRAYYDSSLYTPYERLIQKYHEAWQWSNRLTFSLTWDGRDLRENTTRGYVLSASYTYAGGFLFGLSNYNKLSFSAAGYISLLEFTNEENQKSNLVLSATTQLSFMLPQFWNNTDRNGWGWYSAFQGATKYEALYIDGMNVGRGHSTITGLSLLWHNQLELSYPIVRNILNAEAYISASGTPGVQTDFKSFSTLNWYFSAGVGVKLKISGFPLGLYLVKASKYVNGTYTWIDGGIATMSLVLAITTSIY